MPRKEQEWSTLVGFLAEYAGVAVSLDLRLMGWVTDSELKLVVGFNGFIGKTCQMHVAMLPGYHYSPRPILKAAFHYVFKETSAELVLGIVNSKNKAAVAYDKHLGFEEIYRLPKMHEDNGDLVVFGMNKDQCRYLGTELINEYTQVAGHA